MANTKQNFRGLEFSWPRNLLQMICEELQHHRCTIYRLFEAKIICLDKRNKTKFIILKEKLTNALVFTLPNFNKIFKVDCDASGMGI